MGHNARPLLVGNWKMNRTPEESVSHIAELRRLVAGLPLDIIVMPPTLSLCAAVRAVRGSEIKVGAQNAHFADSGPLTGETSVAMLRAAGVSHVLVGHSERRHLFHETDDIVNLKVAAAVRHGARPIVCVGETREERESGLGAARIVDQVSAALRGVPSELAKSVIVAYEPVWAVGTLTTPSANEANATMADIRRVLAEMYGETLSARAKLLYGGGLRPDNAAEFTRQPQVDGALVGAATASAEAFAGVARALISR